MSFSNVRFDTYVKPSEIWEGASDPENFGYIYGLVRGFNIEVYLHKACKTAWMSCCYIYGEPEEYFNSESHSMWLSWLGATPTGRISFRGYGREEYDYEERDTFVNDVSTEEVKKFLTEMDDLVRKYKKDDE